MNRQGQLDEKWLKVSVIGTVWASSEIVLGSFLHNLRIPFAGSILTSIGVILLISASYVWKEKGLFWRAGLICALLKTISPSAMIFGPMIAIFTESLLMEFSVRLFGKTYLGFTLGAVFAVSWSFIQRIINLLIFYGFNLVELYKNLIEYIEKKLDFQFETPLVPIFAFLSVYVAIGLISAFIGIKSGKKIVSQSVGLDSQVFNNQGFKKLGSVSPDFNYSITWLLANIILIIGSLLIISLTSWEIWTSSTVAVVVLWILKYKRAFRQLSKPKFWIFFVVITMLTALVFTKMQSKSIFDAVFIGIEMNFRATVLILGFSVLGTELYNPKLRRFFAQTKFKNLPLAVELSVESLPNVISNIPDFKTIIKKPTQVILHLIAYSQFKFNELKRMDKQKKTIIVTGKVDVGKTSFVRELVEILHKQKIKVGGIYSQKVYKNDERVGYDVVCIETSRKESFLRKNDDQQLNGVGMFEILPKGLQFGLNCIKSANSSCHDLVIVDEVGKLELSGKGWIDPIESFMESQQAHLLMVINENFTEEFIKKLKLKNLLIIKIPENADKQSFDEIVSLVNASELNFCNN